MRILIAWTLNLVGDYVFKLTNSQVHVAIEGYAYGARGKGIHEIHGLVEMIKQGLWAKHIPFRIYDPLSIKMAWTGHGHATKEMMQQASGREFGHEFRREGAAGENLADATLIAGLLHKELEIRSGRLRLEDTTEHIRKVMIRTTKAEPEAPITRGFVTPAESTAPDPILGKPDSPKLLASGQVIGLLPVGGTNAIEG
jgi:hypothetical protein